MVCLYVLLVSNLFYPHSGPTRCLETFRTPINTLNTRDMLKCGLASRTVIYMDIFFILACHQQWWLNDKAFWLKSIGSWLKSSIRSSSIHTWSLRIIFGWLCGIEAFTSCEELRTALKNSSPRITQILWHLNKVSGATGGDLFCDTFLQFVV